MIKLFYAFAINLLISVPTYALALEQKDINFTADTKALMKGDVFYALDTLTPRNFNKKYPDLHDLDSLAILQEPNVRIVISKSAFIVEKPVGFFDHLNTIDEKFIDHVLGEQKIKKLSENSFMVSVPGENSYWYKMKTYFDSDDISTLPNSKVIRAVTQAKKLDVISQSASSTTYRELTDFSKYFIGGIQVTSYIPLKENKTLVLNYSLLAVKKYYAIEKVLKLSLKLETEAQKDLINSFK
jgi:hypothetical protein